MLENTIQAIAALVVVLGQHIFGSYIHVLYTVRFLRGFCWMLTHFKARTLKLVQKPQFVELSVFLCDSRGLWAVNHHRSFSHPGRFKQYHWQKV